MNRQDVACFGWGPCYVSESWRYTPQTPHIASHFETFSTLIWGMSQSQTSVKGKCLENWTQPAYDSSVRSSWNQNIFYNRGRTRDMPTKNYGKPWTWSTQLPTDQLVTSPWLKKLFPKLEHFVSEFLTNSPGPDVCAGTLAKKGMVAETGDMKI